jgi:hypothetical protein
MLLDGELDFIIPSSYTKRGARTGLTALYDSSLSRCVCLQTTDELTVYIRRAEA